MYTTFKRHLLTCPTRQKFCCHSPVTSKGFLKFLSLHHRLSYLQTWAVTINTLHTYRLTLPQQHLITGKTIDYIKPYKNQMNLVQLSKAIDHSSPLYSTGENFFPVSKICSTTSASLLTHNICKSICIYRQPFFQSGTINKSLEVFLCSLSSFIREGRKEEKYPTDCSRSIVNLS